MKSIIHIAIVTLVLQTLPASSSVSAIRPGNATHLATLIAERQEVDIYPLSGGPFRAWFEADAAVHASGKASGFFRFDNGTGRPIKFKVLAGEIEYDELGQFLGLRLVLNSLRSAGRNEGQLALATVRQDAHAPDCLIFDIVGPDVYGDQGHIRFDASGEMLTY